MVKVSCDGSSDGSGGVGDDGRDSDAVVVVKAATVMKAAIVVS